jgi:hypothetical protein
MISERNAMADMKSDEIEHSVDDGLLPNSERVERMSVSELKELLTLVGDWEGPLVEKFRAHVEARLAAESEGGET